MISGSRCDISTLSRGKYEALVSVNSNSVGQLGKGLTLDNVNFVFKILKIITADKIVANFSDWGKDCK